GVLWAVTVLWAPKNDHLVLHKVTRGTLPITIVERGSLESAKNVDIYCRVKSKTQGGTASTIKWVIDDGTHVVYDRPRDQVSVAFVWDDKSSSYGEEKVSSGGTIQTVKVRDTKSGRWVYADLLMELDDSALVENLKTQQITVDQKKADSIKAEEDYKIQLSQNYSDIEKAKTDVLLAELDLRKYTGLIVEPGSKK